MSILIEENKYSIELLDLTTRLVCIIQEQLDCSFNEACEIAKILFHQVRNKKIVVDASLKNLLPELLKEVTNVART